jgi:hypothetical protein
MYQSPNFAVNWCIKICNEVCLKGANRCSNFLNEKYLWKLNTLIVNIYMPPRSKMGGILILSCLSFWPSLFCLSVHLSSVKKSNLGFNFWLVSTRTLIFHTSIPCDKTFPWVEKCLNLTLVFDLLIENLNFGYIFCLYVLGLWRFTWMFLVTRPFGGYQKFDLDLDVWPNY